MSQLVTQALEGLVRQLSMATSTALGFVILFSLIVLFHEFGHFSVAKLVGMRVFEFSLGFGPALAKRKWRGTLYSVRYVPLGGFVKVAGMDQAPEGEVDDVATDEEFDHQSLWQRIAFVAAGPLMNFVLAYLLIAVYHMAVFIPPTIQGIEPNSPAMMAGLQPGDQILTVNGEPTKAAEHVVGLVQPNAGVPLNITLSRQGNELELAITPQLDPERQVGMLGITLFDQQRQALGPSLRQAGSETVSWTLMILRTLVRMVTGRIEPEISGPVGILVITGAAVQEGLGSILRLAILLNINLGLFNLLPIPALDGFWVFLLLFEAIRGKPLAPEHRGMAQFVGFALLLLLLVFATYQDLMRFI